MTATAVQADIEKVRTFIAGIIARTASHEGAQWLNDAIARLHDGPWHRNAYRTFSMIPRVLGKAPVTLSDAEIAEAARLRKGWSPNGWPVDRLARVFLILHFPDSDPALHKKTLDTLFATADVNELVALYGALPLLPHPVQFADRAAEGIRTNMTVVFDAVVLDNPYPADYLDEAAWNQMVLKAVFVGRPLYRIQGLERRNNLPLALMLSDYAHERWAAGRTVTPEAWRLVAPFLDGRQVLRSDIQRVLCDPNPIQRAGAVLALRETGSAEAQSILASLPGTETAGASALTWDAIAEQWHLKK